MILHELLGMENLEKLTTGGIYKRNRMDIVNKLYV